MLDLAVSVYELQIKPSTFFAQQKREEAIVYDTTILKKVSN
jgi:hypothetical protein